MFLLRLVLTSTLICLPGRCPYTGCGVGLDNDWVNGVRRRLGSGSLGVGVLLVMLRGGSSRNSNSWGVVVLLGNEHWLLDNVVVLLHRLYREEKLRGT